MGFASFGANLFIVKIFRKARSFAEEKQSQSELGRVPVAQRIEHRPPTPGLRWFNSSQAYHVRASFILLALIFYAKNQSSLISLLFLFRKKSRKSRLLGCKRPHNAFVLLPIFYEFCTLRVLKHFDFTMFNKKSNKNTRLLCFHLDSLTEALYLYFCILPLFILIFHRNFM